jgi:hypothetical protein
VLRRWRVKRTRSGTYRLELPAEERQVVRSLLGQLRQLLESGETDQRVRRLFPTAYADDPEKDEEYQRLMRDDLVASRVEGIAMVEASLDATVLTEDQLVAWTSSVNGVRLVLGTMLDISEETDLDDVAPDDPELEAYVLYAYLTQLLDEMVKVLSD